MARLTLRLDDELANRLRAHARSRGMSMSRFAALQLQAAIDPEFEATEAERLREKLRDAGLLEKSLPVRGTTTRRSERPRRDSSNYVRHFGDSMP